MPSRKQVAADLLFGIQIIGAVLFCGAYAIRSLSDVTGTSVAQFGMAVAFLLFHLSLSVGAHKAKASRLTSQAIWTYSIWLFLMLGVILIVLRNPAYAWNEKDTTTLITAIALTVLTVIVISEKHLKVSDPMSKAMFAISYKAIPQILLAWKFIEEGASGTPTASIFMGHMTILIRIGHILFMVREGGMDRNRKWLIISETVNEISWIIASIAWFIMMYT